MTSHHENLINETDRRKTLEEIAQRFAEILVSLLDQTKVEQETDSLKKISELQINENKK